MTRQDHGHDAWVDAHRTLARSPAAAYLSSVSAGSRRTVQQSMVRLAQLIVGQEVDPLTLRWERLTRVTTVEVRAHLKSAYAPATANKILSVLRGVLRTARSMGLMTEGAYQTAASLEMIKPSPSTHVAPFTDEIATRLFEACAAEPGVAGRRDAALLAIFLCSGLRRAEAATLDVGDYDSKTGRLHIRGERPEYDRLVTLPGPARLAMADWLRVRTAEPGPLLLPVDRGGLMRFRRMTDQAIYDIFGRIAARAHVPALSLRGVRRAYVVSLIRSGKAPDEVRYLVGHASWFTAATYRDLAAVTGQACYAIDMIPYVAPKRG